MTNVFYTNRFIPKKFDAINLFFFILIRPEFKSDKGLLAHERVHTRQVWRSFGLHIIMYHISEKWRLRSEVEAYKVSVKHGMPVAMAALNIANKYKLNVSPTNAKYLLLG